MTGRAQKIAGVNVVHGAAPLVVPRRETPHHLIHFRRRAAYRTLIEADAKALIERLGEQAYFEARFRQHDAPEVVDASRPEHHWERVKEAIRRIEGR